MNETQKKIEAQKKARETRQKNQEAKEEENAAIRSAQLAVQRILDNPESTPDEILRAADMLTKLPRYRRY